MNFSQIKEIKLNNVEMLQLSMANHKNWVLDSRDTDGSIFNGKGYLEGYRINSSGGITTTAAEGALVSGFIPYTPSQGPIRVGGGKFISPYEYHGYMTFYDSSFNHLADIHTYTNAIQSASEINLDDSVIETFEYPVLHTYFLPSFSANVVNRIAYFRIGINQGIGGDFVITINQDIGKKTMWQLYTNQLPISTENDGTTIYNGGFGYKNGYRIRSGGAEAAQIYSVCSGFIPVKPLSTVRVYGCNFGTGVNSAVNVSDSTFKNIGQLVGNTAPGYGIFGSGGAYSSYGRDSVVNGNNQWSWTVPPAASGVAFIRITNPYNDGSRLIVIVEEEI